MGAVLRPSGSEGSSRRGLEDFKNVDGSGGALRLVGMEGIYGLVWVYEGSRQRNCTLKIGSS